MQMDAFLWMFLPVFVAGGSALLSFCIMQAKMEVALAKERESLAEARATISSQKVTPVSYTHLDVYKRQVQRRPRPFAAALQSTQPRDQDGEFERFGQIIVRARGKTLQHVLRMPARGEHQSRDAVSYTHLTASLSHALHAKSHAPRR